MSKQLVNLGSVLGKEIVNLHDGSIVGRVQLITVDEAEKKVLGIKIKLKGFLGGKDFIPFDKIKFFGSHTVTVSDIHDDLDGYGRDILGMPVITIEGTVLGRVVDFGFDQETGEIKEYVLSGGQTHDRLHGHVVIEQNCIANVGKDVIIAQEHVDAQDLKEPEEEIYGSWQEVDKILEQLDESPENHQEDESTGAQREAFDYGVSDDEDDLKKIVDKTVNNAEKLWNETKTMVTSEEFTTKVKDQAEKITDEAKVLFHDIKSKINKQDIDQIKGKLSSLIKNNKKNDVDDHLVEQVLDQLQGCSINEPLVDNKGNVLIWPGQVIGNEEVKLAIKEGKLQELISLTTHIISQDDIEDKKEDSMSQNENKDQAIETVEAEIILPNETNK